jgi:hypothetical protein
VPRPVVDIRVVLIGGVYFSIKIMWKVHTLATYNWITWYMNISATQTAKLRQETSMFKHLNNCTRRIEHEIRSYHQSIHEVCYNSDAPQSLYHNFARACQSTLSTCMFLRDLTQCRQIAWLTMSGISSPTFRAPNRRMPVTSSRRRIRIVFTTPASPYAYPKN